MVIRSLFFNLARLASAAAALCSNAPFAASAQVTTTAAAAAPVRSDVAAVIPSSPAEKMKIAGIPNAARVSDALLRGAQPSAQGLAELKKLGVTTIVDLRGNRGPVQRERAAVESLGMRFVDIPVRGISAPSNAQVAQFLSLFTDPAQKIFVHCYYGEDRTGVMVATYRIAQQHWSADQAISEMYSFGFHSHLYRGMKSYVQKFPANLTGESAFATLRSSAATVNDQSDRSSGKRATQ